MSTPPRVPTTHIKNGRVIDPKNGIDRPLDLFLAAGRILAVDEPGRIPPGFVAECTLDAQGLAVIPGLVDLSSRLGRDMETELRAALAGGVTHLLCPPDTDPLLDDPALVERLVRHSQNLGLAQVLPMGALTQGLAGEKLAQLHKLHRAGCIAFSHAQRPLVDSAVLLRAFQYAATFDCPVHWQAQDGYLAQQGVAHDGEVATRLGLVGIPVCAETVALSTALQLAQVSGVRLHITRISSAAGIALVRAAQAGGLAVTCDVGIHHLHCSEQDIAYFDPQARFIPPLRSVEDRAALRAAVAEGLAVLCSDHTPLSADGKQLPFTEALPGATALELLLPLTLQWANENQLPLTTALARISCDPARILGIAAGALTPGMSADLALVDLEQRWCVSAESLLSRGKNTLFLGRELRGRVRTTLRRGAVVFTAQAET
ncbi:MAG: dihydroorotase [Pseudomonadota bacterium]